MSPHYQRDTLIGFILLIYSLVACSTVLAVGNYQPAVNSEDRYGPCNFILFLFAKMDSFILVVITIADHQQSLAIFTGFFLTLYSHPLLVPKPKAYEPTSSIFLILPNLVSYPQGDAACTQTIIVVDEEVAEFDEAI
uniref:Uncharacterized protein n=1 Tax=Glossina pallidipes TaxID=7398 RepID=A0A1B0AJG2_GLOPL